MNGATPFQGLSPEQVTSLKFEEMIEKTAYEHVESEVKAATRLPSLQQSFISLAVIFTLLPNVEQRLPIENLMPLIKLQTSMSIAYETPEQTSTAREESLPRNSCASCDR